MYSIVLGVAAVVALALPFAFVRRRATPGLTPFLCLVLAAGEWAGAAALEHASVAREAKILFAKVEYPGIASVAPLWLTFVLAYTGQGWLTRRRTAALWIVPALTVALAWTNEWHHLVWTTIVPVSPEPGAALAYGHGAWFWLAAAYSHVLLLAGTVALLAALVRFPDRYRRQTLALVVGLALPWIGNALYLGGWRVLEGRDPTPLAFTLTGLVYALGVFGFGLFDLVPLARHTVVDSMADGVLVVDAHDRVIDVNPAARAVLGLVAAPLIGRPVEAVLAAWPEAIARCRDAFGSETELRAEGADGARVLTLRVSPVRGAGGVRARVLVVSDVTARRRTEEALRQNEKLASLARLLAGVAHELNNPLSVIVGHASLLRRHLEPGPIADRVEKIVTGAERCARIVHNFLAVAQQRETERLPTDLNRVLRDAVEFLAYQLQVDEVALVLELAPELPPVWADAQQIHQVAVNLLANAHQALRAREAARRITLTSRALADGRRVAFSVADTGPGIPEALRARIFEPFFTTKAIGDGSGLGLSVCRGLVEAHQGTLELESRAGAGATFTVTLPVSDEPVAPLVAPRAAPRATPRGRRVLVVDDEPMVAELLAELLGAQGHHVETARDGRQALDTLAAGRFDLVITDVKMPGLDGPGLYRALAARDAGTARRVVFVSGDTLSDETRRFLAATGAPILHKPFDGESVRRVVEAALG